MVGGMRKVCWSCGWPSDDHLLGEDGGPRWSDGGGRAKHRSDKKTDKQIFKKNMSPIVLMQLSNTVKNWREDWNGL